MAVIGVRSSAKRPQQTEGLMLGVPFRGQLVQKSWPRKRTHKDIWSHLDDLINMKISLWLEKFMSPCQHKSLHKAAHDLHMLKRDLAYQTINNRLFAFEGTDGHVYWPDRVYHDIQNSLSAIGDGDNQMLIRGGTIWVGTPSSQPETVFMRTPPGWAYTFTTWTG